MIRQTVATVSLERHPGQSAGHRPAAGPRDGGAGGCPGAVPPRLIAVVKANAYGHGATAVGPALESAGAAMLACADIEEGVSLRDAGVRIPILVFGALSVSHLDGVFDYGLTPTLSTPGAARALSRQAARRGVVLGCHLKIDTGMNRLGFRHDNLRRTLAGRARQSAPANRCRLHAPGHGRRSGIRRSSTNSGCDSTRRTAALRAMGLPPPRRHAANSAALLRDARTWYEWVRPGPAAVRDRAAAARRRPRPATCPVTDQPYRGRQGHATR